MTISDQIHIARMDSKCNVINEIQLMSLL